MKKTYPRFLFLILVFPILLSCGNGGSSTVFAGADNVIISKPEPCKKVWFGSDSQESEIFTFGVSKTALGINERRVFAAVFYTDPPIIDPIKNVIQNKEDTVWVWSSGMYSKASAKNGSLNFSDGNTPSTDPVGEPPVSMESCYFENSCGALRQKMIVDSPKPYYIAIWAWNDYRNISYYSDDPVPFCWTSNKSDEGMPCSNIDPIHCKAN